MELLQLDIAHIKSQLELTGKFLPESFFQHAEDGDGIEVVLIFPNLIQRLNLLSSQVKNKVGSASCVYMSGVMIEPVLVITD